MSNEQKLVCTMPKIGRKSRFPNARIGISSLEVTIQNSNFAVLTNLNWNTERVGMERERETWDFDRVVSWVFNVFADGILIRSFSIGLGLGTLHLGSFDWQLIARFLLALYLLSYCYSLSILAFSFLRSLLTISSYPSIIVSSESSSSWQFTP